ncbi:MAG: nuclear transport factor 2 family protein [Terracidiphilus sp.]
MTTATLNEKSTRIHNAKDESDILALIERALRARHDKDAAAIVAPYAQDAAVYNLAPPLSHHGVDQKETQAWLDTWATPIDLESRDFSVTVSGDFAFCYGFLRMRGTKKGTEGKVDFWMRETLCLERAGGGWRIVHEHTSVPFYMDGTLRPAFDLQP